MMNRLYGLALIRNVGTGLWAGLRAPGSAAEREAMSRVLVLLLLTAPRSARYPQVRASMEEGVLQRTCSSSSVRDLRNERDVWIALAEANSNIEELSDALQAAYSEIAQLQSGLRCEREQQMVSSNAWTFSIIASSIYILDLRIHQRQDARARSK